MKKVRMSNTYVVNDNNVRCFCPMDLNHEQRCDADCMWFNIIELASVKRITCHGVEIAELVENKK